MSKYDLFSSEFFANPDPVFHLMRENNPVYWEPTLEAWVLTRYRDIRSVLNDGRFTVNRNARIRTATPPAARDKLAACYRFLSKWMIFTDEPAHRRLHSVIGPAYTPTAVRALEASVNDLVDELMTGADERGSLDVIRDLAHPLTGITNARRIGFPAEMMEQVRRWSDDVFLLFGSGIVTEEIVAAAHESLVECYEYVRKLIASPDLDRTAGLLGRLCTGLANGSIADEEELISSCMMVMIGGHEAARHMIGNGLLALLRNASELVKLRTRPELMDGAVEELLRYDSPPLSALRQATVDVKIGGEEIRAGQFVFNMLRAGNHDPETFDNPDRLDIERTGSQHLGFGYGIHFCTGASLAPLQVKAALRALVDRDLELGIPDHSLQWIPSLSSRGLRSLPVNLRYAGDAH